MGFLRENWREIAIAPSYSKYQATVKGLLNFYYLLSSVLNVVKEYEEAEGAGNKPENIRE